ncbi:hypothetical protein WMF18_01265 [Sorangium sp. So ce315]|uniref:hypothetical protein n=1 Tax=Sorangium sp. So ce315 TaxID=3133299 RepID=UPI003F62D5D2
MNIDSPDLQSSSPRTTASSPKRSGIAALAALAALAVLGATGCAAEVRTRTVARAPATVTYQEFAVVEEPVVHIMAPPAYIETYPRVYYRGTYVYYVDGRWYYPSRHGWVYYREEPRALVRYRVEFDRSRVHRHDHHHGHHHHRPASRATSRPAAEPRVEHRRHHVEHARARRSP